MLAATAIAIFLIPVSFYLVEKLTSLGKRAKPALEGGASPESTAAQH
jgi:hypothetical protein